jgi:hypothetical protein
LPQHPEVVGQLDALWIEHDKLDGASEQLSTKEPILRRYAKVRGSLAVD